MPSPTLITYPAIVASNQEQLQKWTTDAALSLADHLSEVESDWTYCTISCHDTDRCWFELQRFRLDCNCLCAFLHWFSPCRIFTRWSRSNVHPTTLAKHWKVAKQSIAQLLTTMYVF
jgi:hypothetical protein